MEEYRLIVSPTELHSVVSQAVSAALQDLPQSKHNSTRPLTIGEAMEFIQCSESTIRKAVRSGKLKYSRQAGKLFFFENDLNQWIRG